MMPRSLLTYITFFLFFTISFLTQRTRNSLLKNEIVPKITQTKPSFKLYDFLIYPSNGTFKTSILPFISSSENLLKIYFHFQKLNPNVNLDKFLPYSTIKKTVLDLQDSPFIYIFQDEYKFFNPIVYSENNYKICTMDDKNIKEGDIYALVSPNKIFSLETYIFQNNLKVYAARDQENGMFFVAIKTNQRKLTAISHGPIKSQINFPDDLDCILKAHTLTGFSKIYFNVFDFNHKYHQFVLKTWMKIEDANSTALDNMCLCKTLSIYPKLLATAASMILLYHAMIFPFHILSIPFEFFLFKNNFMLSSVISKNFMYFWGLPSSLYIIFFICFPKMMELDVNTTQIKPLKTMWAVKYLVERKKVSVFESIINVLILLMGMFWLGLFSSLPFLPLFIIYGEAYNE